MDLRTQLRRHLIKLHVRPWALLAPILVLLICLPLLRPLRHPDPREISDDELARLATVQSLAEHRTLAIDSADFVPTRGIIHRGGRTFSAQPPTLSVLLAGPYWAMRRFGLTFQSNPSLVEYLLTLLGAALPVAAGAGLIYRMGRLFELPRKRRALLAGAVVFGGGLVSYGTVINSQAPAAALLLASAACLIYVATARRPGTTSGWLAIAGLCAAFAAAIEPFAAIFVILFACVIPVMRWRWLMRVGGLALYVLGVAPPVLLHVALMRPITGDAIPLELGYPGAVGTVGAVSNTDDLDDAIRTTSWWDELGHDLSSISNALLGEHGVFSHFPLVILGAFGVAAVMHRHWPATTKVLASATVIGGIAIVVVSCVVLLGGAGNMFGPQTYILFLPLMLFWTGAWMRRPHHAIKWSMAGVLLAFSAAATIIGATNPCPRQGYDHYTVAAALSNLRHPQASQSAPVLANR